MLLGRWWESLPAPLPPPFRVQVLKESMRLHPVASTGTVRQAAVLQGGGGALLLFGGQPAGTGAHFCHPTCLCFPLRACRKADRMVELGGYRLAPRTILWVPLVAMLTSQHNWERAEEFWPERWEAEGQPPAGGTSGPTRLGHSSLPSKTYLPFSDGERAPAWADRQAGSLRDNFPGATCLTTPAARIGHPPPACRAPGLHRPEPGHGGGARGAGVHCGALPA